MSREFTKQECLNELMRHFRELIDYWDNVDGTSRRKLEGLMHSVLCTFDGCSGGLPAYDIATSPHVDDKEYHIEIGTNYYPQSTVVNDEVCMHEILFR